MSSNLVWCWVRWSSRYRGVVMSTGRYTRKRPVAQSITEDETVEDSSRNVNVPLEHCTSSSLLSESAAHSTSNYEHLSSTSLKSFYDWCVYHIFTLINFYFSISIWPKSDGWNFAKSEFFLLKRQYELLFSKVKTFPHWLSNNPTIEV